MKIHLLEAISQCNKRKCSGSMSDTGNPFIFLDALEVQLRDGVDPVSSLHDPPKLQQEAHRMAGVACVKKRNV